MLPSSVLREDEDEDSIDSQNQGNTVHPNDSVYPAILSIFDGQDMFAIEAPFVEISNGPTLEMSVLIDYVKLGFMAFQLNDVECVIGEEVCQDSPSQTFDCTASPFVTRVHSSCDDLPQTTSRSQQQS